jgi:hypothetical protein
MITAKMCFCVKKDISGLIKRIFALLIAAVMIFSVVPEMHDEAHCEEAVCSICDFLASGSKIIIGKVAVFVFACLMNFRFIKEISGLFVKEISQTLVGLRVRLEC